MHDDVMVYKVMVEELDRGWWSEYRKALRLGFWQEALEARAQRVEVL